MQIFLAHASEDKKQARDLHSKLASEGFNPWLAEVDLVPGQNWQVEIPNAIRQSDIFLACLSHVSAAKQGYVQREFRLALNVYAEKPPGTIFLIPVKLDDCEIPDLRLPELGINLRDIQWLEIWKPAGFKRLLAAIRTKASQSTRQAEEAALTAIAGRRGKKDAGSSNDSFDFIKPEKMIPKLLAEIRQELPESIYPAIHSTEEESSMFQSLINEKSRDFVGREFVFAELEAFLNTENRGYFVIEGEPGVGKTSLLAYLAKTFKYVCHFNDELLGIIGAEHFLQNVCVQLITQYQQGRHYIPKNDFQDGRYFNQLLEDISGNLTEGERIIILVDALDEAEKAPGTGANWLYLPSRLPPRVYFVLTTRPLRNMPLFVDCPRKDFSLESGSQENLTDIRRYIELALDRGPLLIKIQAAQLKVNEFVVTLLRKSEGNFMYLYYVLPELESGDMRTGELPQGLMGYYERHWQKMKSADLNQWVKLQQPVICVLAAVREPVTVKQVADFTRGLTPTQVAAVIGDWRQFLRESWAEGERRYRLYHTSFQDFLKKKDEVGEVDLKQTHRNIAEVLKQWLKPGKGNP